MKVWIGSLDWPHLGDLISAPFSVNWALCYICDFSQMVGIVGVVRISGPSFYRVSSPIVTFFTWWQKGLLLLSNKWLQNLMNKLPPFYLLITLWVIILGEAQFDGSSSGLSWCLPCGLTEAEWSMMLLLAMVHWCLAVGAGYWLGHLMPAG